MPPTMSVTVGRLEAELTFDPVAVELLEPLGLPELPHAARTVASAATPAALVILMRVEKHLDMGCSCWCASGWWMDGGSSELEGPGGFRYGRPRPARAAARTAGAVPAGRS